MQDNQEKCKELAIRIYNLDEEVYKCVGSSLGRTFTGQKETTLRHLAALMYTKPDGHLLRSELALISNMARTIRDKSERRRLMIEYDSILKEIESLPDTFGQTDIVDKERISLNNLIARRQNEISENDHLIICISRTQGSGGNDIGFELADQLQINYYVSMKITPKGCLSRSVAGIRARTLIITLPGSQKASAENILAVIDPVAHGLDMLYSEGSADCAK